MGCLLYLISICFLLLNAIGHSEENRIADDQTKYDASHTKQDRNGITPVFNLEARLQTYIDAICSKCLHRNIECGCAQGHLNPPFQILKEYAHKYHEWTTQARNAELGQHSHRWLVVDFFGGLGNQLLRFVNGIQVSLATGRILVLKVPDVSKESFKYDSLVVLILSWIG